MSETYQSFSLEEIKSVIIDVNEPDIGFFSKKFSKCLLIGFSIFFILLSYRILSKCH